MRLSYLVKIQPVPLIKIQPAPTPTRLKQSLADVPASVTVISAKMISDYGIRNVPEALRFVPGMAVTQVSGTDYRINYHGTSIISPRRLNVLIDGMSVYRPAFAIVDWKSIPIAIEDIERIEVTRGPASASYGANSTLAVVNIISKDPGDVEGTTLKTTYGSDGAGSVLARHGGKLNDSTTFRMSLEQTSDGGFDTISYGGATAHDTTRLNKLTFRSTTELANDESVDLQASFVQGKLENQIIDRYQASFPDVYSTDYFVKGLWRKTISANHEVQVQAYLSQHDNKQSWRTCPPTALFLPELGTLYRANPSYVNAILAGRVPSGGTAEDNRLAVAALTAIARLGASALQPTCVTTNHDYTERRADIDLQSTYVASPAFRVVYGLGFRKDSGDSQTFLAGQVTNTTWRAFANAEYKPISFLSINGGGFYEHASLAGASFSPRIAFNFHLNENHTIRFVGSKATRMPDIKEQSAKWSYYATDFSQPLNGATEGYFYQSATSPGGLVGENISSREIGLLSNFPSSGLLLDARFFHDKLTDLISEKISLASFEPTNSNHATLKGAELQLGYSPSERWSINLGYAYLRNIASNDTEQTQYARTSGSIAVSHLSNTGWRTSLAYMIYNAKTAGQTPFSRGDLTVTKSFRLGKDSTLTPSFTLSYLDQLSSTYTYQPDTKAVRESAFSNHLIGYLALKLTF